MIIPSWYHRELSLGDSGSDVAIVQRKLLQPTTGVFDLALERLIKGVQMAKRLPATGVIDAPTATELGEKATAGLVPTWFVRDLQLWVEGEDVRIARGLLGLGVNDNRYDPDAEAAVRRLQSANGIRPDGLVTEREALLIGDVEID